MPDNNLNRKEKIGNFLIEEFLLDGTELIVFINDICFHGTFEDAVRTAREAKQ